MNRVQRVLTESYSISPNQFFLRLLSSLGFLSLLTLYFVRENELAAVDVYLLFLFFIMGAGSFLGRGSFDRQSISGWELLFSIGSFFGFLLWNVFRSNIQSIWPDEGYHLFFNSIFLPMESAARQVNPPLISIFNTAITGLFLDSERGARIFSSFCFAGLFISVFFLLRKLKVSFWLSFILSLSLVFHPLLLLFSVEARPVVPGLFLLVLFFRSIHTFLVDDEEVSSVLYVFICMLFLFLTFGFQPYVVGLSSGIIFLGWSMRQKKFLLGALVLLLAFFLFYPIQRLIVGNSRFRFADIYPGLIVDWSKLDFFQWYSLFWNYYLWPLFWTLPFIFLVSFFVDKKEIGNWVADRWNQLLLLIFISAYVFFFPLLYLFIREQFQVYYFALLLVLNVLFIGSFFSLMEKLQISRLQKNLLFGLFSIVFLFWHSVGMNKPKTFSDDFYRPDLRTAIRDLALDANDRGSFYLADICVRGSRSWCPDEPYYSNVYLTKYLSNERAQDSIFSRTDTLKFFRDSFKRPFQVKTIYFLFHDMKPVRRREVKAFLDSQRLFKSSFVFESEGFLVWAFSSERSDSRLDIFMALEELESFCGLMNSDCFWIKGLKLLGSPTLGSVVEKEKLLSAFRQEFTGSPAGQHRSLDLQRFFDLVEEGSAEEGK